VDAHLREQLLQLEQDFWRAAGDRGRYEANLASGAIHVFPGWGIADRQAVLDGVSNARPWARFLMTGVRVVRLVDDVAALVYVVEASRGDEPAYDAAITSVYRRRRDGWELVLHQQTPVPADESR
jgi:hypothetical protein